MSDAALLAAYLATTWMVRLPAGVVRVRIGRPAPTPRLRAAGIVTAYNPASRPSGREENEAANARLLADLRTDGAEWLPALAGGVGAGAARWDEPGFVVLGLAAGAVVALGGRYGQNAVVCIDAAGMPALVVSRDGFCGRRAGDLLQPPRH